MTRTVNDFRRAYADELGVPVTEARRHLEALGKVVSRAMRRGEDALVPGVGKLSSITRKARTGRNPRTGETVDIPERRDVKFKAASELKAAL